MKNRLLIFLFLILSIRGYSQSCSTISFTQTEPAICNGSTIMVTAIPKGGTAPYAYSWSTGDTGPTIPVNKAGSYTVTITDKTAGCSGVSQTVNVTASSLPNQPSATTPVLVCSGSTANLVASGAPAGATYQWFDAAGNLVSGQASWTTGPISSAVTYYVQVTKNGCISSPRKSVFVLITGRPSVSNPVICAGSRAFFKASGGDSYRWYASPDINGPVLSTDSIFVTDPLFANKTYFVVATTGTCVSGPTPGTAFVSSPPTAPVASVNPVCSGSSANLHASGAPSGAIYNWYASEFSNTSLISSPDYTTPPLTVNTDYWVQVSSGTCLSARTKVTVQVNPVPNAPTDQPPIEVCYNAGTILKAGTDQSLKYNWYDAPFGGKILQLNSITYNTGLLTNSTAFYVEAATATCNSGRTKILVNVDPPLSTPQVSSPTICYNSPATLLPTSPGGTYTWFTAAGTKIITTTTAPFITPALTATTTYYVQTTVGSCTSAKVPVVVTVNPTTPKPTVPSTTVSVCTGTSAHLTASGGTSYMWYNNANDLTPASTGDSYDTAPLTTTKTFYVENISNDCPSSRVAVTVIVSTAPNMPIVQVPATVCQGTQPAIVASAAGGGTFDWYDVNGIHLATTANGSNFIPPQPLTTETIFYVTNSVGQCSTTRVKVDVPVIIIPNPQFQYTSGSVCAAGVNPKPVINNTYGGTFTASPAGLKFLSKTTGEIDPAVSAPGNYTITFTSNAPCPTTSTASLSVINTANASFTYNNPVCQNGANPLPVLLPGGSTGTFSCATPGLVFVNTSTGEINLATSKPGTYTITNNIAPGPCTSGDVKTSTITIVQGVIVKADPNSAESIANGNAFALNGNITGAVSTGRWSASSGSFSDPSSLTAVYTPAAGVASVVLTLTSDDPPGVCGPQKDTFTLYINLKPVSPTASALPICAGSTGSLSATAPGGNYQWFDVPTGGTALGGGATFTTPNPLFTTTTFYVSTTVAGLTSGRTPVVVTVNDIPQKPNCPPLTVCSGAVATLTATDLTGSYEWYDSQNGGNKLSIKNPFVTPALSASVTYYVQRVSNGCISARIPIVVTVNPVPVVNSPATDFTCSGTSKPYTATADLTGTTFTWTRNSVTGITNPAATGKSGDINEVLISNSLDIVNVIYMITPHLNGCDGTPFLYLLKVYPNPEITNIQATPPLVCSSSSSNYLVAFNVPGVSFSWSRKAVPGITNAPVFNQSASTIKEVLFNNTNNKIQVDYIYNFKTSSCSGIPTTYSVIVNPEPRINPQPVAVIQSCSGFPQSITVSSNLNYAILSYSRDVINGIKQGAVTLVPISNNTIDEVLDNTTNKPIVVIYNVVASANGCSGNAVKYKVTVNPVLAKPLINSNSPICVGSTINLTTTAVTGATYLWTGPNGYTATTKDPATAITDATAANSGVYNVVVISSNKCQSPQSAGSLVVVNPPPFITVVPTANACAANGFIPLSGISSTGTGVWTTISGSGTFSLSTSLDTKYIPSDADKAAGSVTVRLTSTGKDNCTPAHGDVLIRFVKKPAVTVGKDTALCSQIGSFQAAGKISIPGGVKWTTSGTGTFSDASLPITTYYPSAADIKNVQLTLTLTALAPTECDDPSASFNLTFIPPPTAYAGGNRYVLYGSMITLNPIVNEEIVTYLWSPNYNISDPTVKNPIITGGTDTTYTLTVTDPRGCIAQDKAKIIVSPIIKAPNTFTPNGDGINDRWEITGLIAYQNATVDIFTRNGQKIYHSLGYPIPWDGTYDGKQMPAGVYYYVIASKFNGQILSGWVTIIR